MVQLPSAARLSGNRRPSRFSGLLQRLQDAAGLYRDGQVGGVDAARTAFMRRRLSSTWRPELSGVEPTTSPVLPPWGTMDGGGLLGGARPTTTATSATAGGAHHGQGLALAAPAPVLFPGAQVGSGVCIVRQHMGGADDRRSPSSRSSSSVRFMAHRLQTQPHMQRAGNKQGQAQGDLHHGQVRAGRAGRPRRAPRPR